MPGSVADHTVCLLLKLGQVAFRLSEDRLDALGLRVRHYSILQALADNGPQPQLGLGAYLRIDPATMASSLDFLENTGYLARARDRQDRRRYVVEITAAGSDLLARANTGLEGLDATMFADLAAADRETLHRVLGKLASEPGLPALYDAVREPTASKKQA